MSNKPGVVLSQDARRSGTDGVGQLTRMLKDKSLGEPQKGFEAYVSRARNILDRTRPKIEEARAFIDSSARRPDLDDRTLHAETTSARAVVSLFETLETLYSRAKDGTSTYPLKCIIIAANSIAAYMKNEHVLKPEQYPDNDAVLLGRIVESKIAVAKEIHGSVMKALDGSHEQLGIVMPECPSG